jgi:hypothetical protein
MLGLCLARVRNSRGLPLNPSQAEVQTLGSIIMGMGFAPDPKWRHLPKSLQVAGFSAIIDIPYKTKANLHTNVVLLPKRRRREHIYKG